METYEEFINNILNTRGRFACGEEYHERHHIIPKCMGGTNDEENLIDLYAREHFEVHRLLALENPDNEKLVYAWWCMSTMKNEYTKERYEISAEEYEEIKIMFSKVPRSEEYRRKLSERAKERMAIPENNPMFGISPQERMDKDTYALWCQHLSESLSGERHPFYGKQHSEETRKKMSEMAKERFKDKNNHPAYGQKMSDEQRKKLSEILKGRRTGGDNPRAKPIQCVETGVIYSCAIEASHKTGIGVTNIRKAKNHSNRTAGGYHWNDFIAQQNELEDEDEI